MAFSTVQAVVSEREDVKQSVTEFTLPFCIKKADFLPHVAIRNVMITIRNMLSMTSTNPVLQCKDLPSHKIVADFFKGGSSVLGSCSVEKL